MTHEELIEAARDYLRILTADDIAIHDDAELDEACDGVWVQAWVYVEDKEAS